ncbi:MAG: hypothetical protein ACYCX4_10250 [Bacillota bacterium]
MKKGGRVKSADHNVSVVFSTVNVNSELAVTLEKKRSSIIQGIALRVASNWITGKQKNLG